MWNASKTDSSKTDIERLKIERFFELDEQGIHPKKLALKPVRKILAEIWAFKPTLYAGTGLVLISTVATLIEPRLLGYAIDEAIQPKRWDLLKSVTALYLVLEISRVGAAILSAYLFTILGQKVMQNLRMRLFTHLQRLPLYHYDQVPSGRLVTRVTNDIAALADMFTAGFVTVFGNLLVIMGTLGGLFWLNTWLGFITLLVFPMLIWMVSEFSKRLRSAYRNARSKLGAVNAFLAELFMGIREVHLFGRQQERLKRFCQSNDAYASAQYDSVRVFALLRASVTVYAGLAMALVIWFGSGMTVSGQIKVGLLVAAFAYVQSLFDPIRDLTDKWNIFLAGMASAERIFSILDWKPEDDSSRSIVASEHAPPIKNLKGHVVFENVWFAYQGENWVLKDVSFEIAPGSKTGIVGATGSGKTTLISLLMRFYEIQKGRILLDGRDIREYDRRALRAGLGMIQQDVFLFSGSIRENVSLWSKEREKSMPDLSRLPFSIDLGRELQERGKNLSMGEKQVIAFFRAMASNPAIWILDEATANIDSETEQKIEKVLSSVGTNHTRIVIAHRLATIRDADQILVINHGRLVERGTHRDLLKAEGLYRRLYSYQIMAAGAPG